MLFAFIDPFWKDLIQAITVIVLAYIGWKQSQTATKGDVHAVGQKADAAFNEANHFNRKIAEAEQRTAEAAAAAEVTSVKTAELDVRMKEQEKKP